MKARWLFLALVLAELAHTAVAIVQHRMPSSHDGFLLFSTQYYFLNNAIQAHDVAQWIPQMTQGTVASYWFGIQGGILQHVLLWIPSAVRHVDLLSVFHAGMLVDQLLLLAGTWLLARRFFRTPAVCFIALSVVGSSVWMDQPYFNLRLYYALPLVLELGHRFLDTGRWRWFILSANLLALNAVTSDLYFLIFQSFVVAMYFSALAAASHRRVWAQVRAIPWGWPALVAVVLAAASVAAATAYLTSGTDQLANYNLGRNLDATVDLDTFLSYGGSTDAFKWFDTLFNVSPWLDFTLYGGILLAPLVLCGLVGVDRRRLHFVALAVILLLFTLATPVSVAAYYLWPGMKYFRHIGLVSPLVKVIWCFVAGVGFERLFNAPAGGRVWRTRAPAIAGALLLAGAAVIAIAISRHSSDAIGRYVNEHARLGAIIPLRAFADGELAARFRWAAGLAVAGAIVVFGVPLLLGSRRLTGSTRARHAAVAAVLLFVAADVYRFKFRHLFDRSDVVQQESRDLTQPAPMPFAPRRAVQLNQLASNPRVTALAATSRREILTNEGIFQPGTIYWTTDAFLLVDEAGASFRVDSWLKPLDQLMRMWWKDPIDDGAIGPRGLETWRLTFPLDSPAASRLGGVDADKIRFFARAYRVDAASDLVRPMTDPAYAGNLLFVLPPATGAAGAQPTGWTGQTPLQTDDTLPLAYRVLRFDANTLEISVTNPGAPAWMSYADVWHPEWRATVNGQPVPVYRANMAYKAVPIGSGENVVRLHFGSMRFSRLASLYSANAAGWLAGVAILTAGLLRRRDEDDGA